MTLAGSSQASKLVVSLSGFSHCHRHYLQRQQQNARRSWSRNYRHQNILYEDESKSQHMTAAEEAEAN